MLNLDNIFLIDKNVKKRLFSIVYSDINPITISGFTASEYFRYDLWSVVCGTVGTDALRSRMVLRGTIDNNFIFIGHCRGYPIQQPIKTT